MTAAMRHRGPDDDGFLVDEARAPGLALGMRRLSIIDLKTGHQPVWNETRDVAVIFNGELYNYRELRDRLILFGHRFSTQSDTEILVHAWEEWGEDCLEELRGMFALALLDLRKRYATAPLLFLARDPLGIKPLYYTQTSDGFAFASEIRALVAGKMAAKTLSQDALTSYFLFGSVSEPVTLLDGVFSLPPGHRMLVYVPERRRMPRARAWWDATRSPAAKDEGGTRSRRFLFRSEEFTDPAGKCRARAPDCGCSSGIVSFQRFGFQRDCGDCGAGTGRNLQFYAEFSGNGIR